MKTKYAHTFQHAYCEGDLTISASYEQWRSETGLDDDPHGDIENIEIECKEIPCFENAYYKNSKGEMINLEEELEEKVEELQNEFEEVE